MNLSGSGQVVAPNLNELCPWLVIAVGQRNAGVKRGDSDSTILEYLQSTPETLETEYDPEATAWCAAFVNWCMARSGEQPRNSLAAADWAKFGICLPRPQLGAICVFGKNSIPYHVGFFLRFGVAGSLRILGGNQGKASMVKVSNFPRGELLAVRWPKSERAIRSLLAAQNAKLAF